MAFKGEFFADALDVQEDQTRRWVNSVQGTLSTVVQNGRGREVVQTGFAVVGTNCYGEEVSMVGKSYELERQPIEQMAWPRRVVGRPVAARNAQKLARARW